LLHGLFNSGLYWGARYDDLAGAGSLIAPDLLGFGRSPRPPSGYSAAAHADAVADALRANGATGPVVVGAHSLGALVAIHLADRHPELVAGVVAFSPPLYPSTERARRCIARADPVVRAFMASDSLGERLCALMCRHPTAAARLVRVARPDLPAALAADRVQHSWWSYSETLDHVILAADAHRVLAGLRIPVHLIAGSEDRALDHQLLGVVAGRADHVELHTIDGAGHDLPLSHPDDCIEALRAMLRTTRAA
jgi:pimeloyl-ACP methyl ester carboxylesterase